MEPLRKVDTIYADAGCERRPQRILSAATLPALLRVLTDVNTSTQYDVWSLVLHIRQYSTAKYTLDFLRSRYLMSTAQAQSMAAELADEDRAGVLDGPEPDGAAWLDSQLKRHLLGGDLFRAVAGDIASAGDEEPASLSEFYIEVIVLYLWFYV